MEAVGLEPTMPGASDLQSDGVTNFPTPPKIVMITLPSCAAFAVRVFDWPYPVSRWLYSLKVPTQLPYRNTL